MRDRETDSWWSIMRSSAIGGPLDGAELVELPHGEKTTWAEWRRRHPDTEVLSVGGKEHEPRNPYDGYFSSDETFRDLEISDLRLRPKSAIFAFWVDGQPHAAPHAAFAGGRIFSIDGQERQLALFRPADAPIFASTQAFWIDLETAAASSPAALLALIRKGPGPGIEPVSGIDTFWYNWIAVNESSALLE